MSEFLGPMISVFLLLGTTLTVAWAEEPQEPAPSRVFDTNGFRVRLDLSRATILGDIPEDKTFGDEERKIEPPLAAVPRMREGFLPAAVLGWKAKQFDDGLYAAVEIEAQRQGQPGGKWDVLQYLAKVLNQAAPDAGELGNVPGVVLGAARLGGVNATVPAVMKEEVETAVEEFLGDERASKPLGFYTWSDPLMRIFRQDRLLQTELKGKRGITTLAASLRSSAAHRQAYERYLKLVAGLTNPLVSPDLRSVMQAMDRGEVEAPEGGVSILPASRSHETELIKRLYGDRPIPDGFDLAGQVLDRVRAGSLTLEPLSDSGWYDWQTWALEPLIVPERMPEAAKIRFSASYCEQLDALFRALLTLTRETHVKQVEFPTAAAALPPDIFITPELSAEPLPTHYLRRALAYSHVRKVLIECFGADGVRRMRRVTAGGETAGVSLDDELRQMQAICFGAYAVVSRQLGIPVAETHEAASGGDTEADIKVFQAWLRQLPQDPALGGDSRVMVPVFYDQERDLTKVWVVLGWAERLAFYSYESQPGLIVTRGGQPVKLDQLSVGYESTVEPLPYPVTAELYVSKILNREEFRAICDRHQTQTAILERLK